MEVRLSLSIFLLILVIITSGCTQTSPGDDGLQDETVETYDPQINPSDFSTDITNKYFSMPVGKKMVYELHTEDGIERVEVLIPGWTKNVIGVETLVFWDRVYLDGELIEDARDYLAQDSSGNVWYFGEDFDNHEGGVITDHSGAWISGVDGAKPGIWMVADPQVGDEFRQEYYKGEAEDMGRVDGLGVEVTIPLGTYSDCVKVYEWTPLDDVTAYKYHCSEAGGIVLEEEGDINVELIELDLTAAKCIELPTRFADEGVLPGFTSECSPEELVESGVNESVEEVKTEITEERAREIALATLDGTITDIGIEMKYDKLAYVVEMMTPQGEQDVVIDKDTGEVISIE